MGSPYLGQHPFRTPPPPHSPRTSREIKNRFAVVAVFLSAHTPPPLSGEVGCRFLGTSRSKPRNAKARAKSTKAQPRHRWQGYPLQGPVAPVLRVSVSNGCSSVLVLQPRCLTDLRPILRPSHNNTKMFSLPRGVGSEEATTS
jgi:hypothetical protein